MKWLLILVCLAGCADRQAIIEERLSRWDGMKQDMIVTRWGSPEGKEPLQSGGVLYTYTSDSVSSSTGLARKTTNIHQTKCLVTLTVQDGVVKGHHWDGHLSECFNYIPEAPAH